MTEWNTGSAILVIGALYLFGAYHLDFVLTAFLVAVGLASWGYLAYSDERKTIIKAQARYWEAKADYWERKKLGTK